MPDCGTRSVCPGGTAERARTCAIDLPYSNFAYSQTGTPWPVNQAVYVDYMLYDLRGYNGISTEELEAQYRNNQESTGHVNGYANWLVYTPGMLYAVAQNSTCCRTTGKHWIGCMPQSMKALDWCLAELRHAASTNGATKGLVIGPLNDRNGRRRLGLQPGLYVRGARAVRARSR